jgi:hypothetical protein
MSIEKKVRIHQPLVRLRLRGFDCVVNIHGALLVAALAALLRFCQHFGH